MTSFDMPALKALQTLQLALTIRYVRTTLTVDGDGARLVAGEMQHAIAFADDLYIVEDGPSFDDADQLAVAIEDMEADHAYELEQSAPEPASVVTAARVAAIKPGEEEALEIAKGQV